MLAVSWRAPIARTSPVSGAGGTCGDSTSKYNRRLVVHLLALLGILSISFSAIFVRLAAVSPVTATFYRGAYAVPVLLEIGKERVLGGTAEDELLDIAAQELIDEATRL